MWTLYFVLQVSVHAITRRAVDALGADSTATSAAGLTRRVVDELGADSTAMYDEAGVRSLLASVCHPTTGPAAMAELARRCGPGEEPMPRDLRDAVLAALQDDCTDRGDHLAPANVDALVKVAVTDDQRPSSATFTALLRKSKQPLDHGSVAAIAGLAQVAQHPLTLATHKRQIAQQLAKSHLPWQSGGATQGRYVMENVKAAAEAIGALGASAQSDDSLKGLAAALDVYTPSWGHTSHGITHPSAVYARFAAVKSLARLVPGLAGPLQAKAVALLQKAAAKPDVGARLLHPHMVQGGGVSVAARQALETLTEFARGPSEAHNSVRHAFEDHQSVLDGYLTD